MEVDEPLAGTTNRSALTVDVEAEAGPATTVTDADELSANPSTVAQTVMVPGVVGGVHAAVSAPSFETVSLEIAIDPPEAKSATSPDEVVVSPAPAPSFS